MQRSDAISGRAAFLETAFKGHGPPLFLNATVASPAGSTLGSTGASIHHLNHRPRRCIQGRTPCECFHDPAQRLELPVKARKLIFRLFCLRYCQTLGAMELGNHHQQAAAWHLTVEHWLRCQNWIAVATNSRPKPQTNAITQI
jgi:hypothetical protein